MSSESYSFLSIVARVVDLLLTFFSSSSSHLYFFTFPMKHKRRKKKKVASQEAIGVGPIDWRNGRRGDVNGKDGRKLEGKRLIRFGSLGRDELGLSRVWIDFEQTVPLVYFTFFFFFFFSLVSF
jgi:hypothetical protein